MKLFCPKRPGGCYIKFLESQEAFSVARFMMLGFFDGWLYADLIIFTFLHV